jgi:hypothetical protein
VEVLFIGFFNAIINDITKQELTIDEPNSLICKNISKFLKIAN